MRRLLASTAAAVAGTAATVLLFTGAPVAAADDLPPVAVEDFVYPDADRIYAEHGIRLTTGDGHILLAACGPAGLIEVWAGGHDDPFCFSVTGSAGRLAMELPNVYGIKGNAYKIVADMTVEGTETSFDVTPNTWTPVGATADPPEGREHMLVELNATK
ncbi:hypothetical protein PV396_38680 [Streptomyces sp. ME02-8801-2C]|uniref:hypothetical protein n=1 Tax=Streptomyces sp. ME02-8801-2C TaxID=3028680 RepID=UPI0029B2844E|nr:hypothetical protein [Streptomyces sp. ME02-8801-2C]MDX3457810.1 hypothetical protein [Streptomyces sp. ME02-8801-2C]